MAVKKYPHLTRGYNNNGTRRNVENYEDMSATKVKKGEIKKRERTYCVAAVANDVRNMNDTPTQGISTH